MVCDPAGQEIYYLLSRQLKPCLPLSSLYPLIWMVCPPSPGSCFPLCPLVPLLCPFKSMVCPPSPVSCLPLSPALLPSSMHGVSQTLMETSRELQLPFSFLGQLTTGSQQREHCPSNECPLSPPVSACTPSNGWCVRPFIWWCARLLPGPCTTSYAWCARILPGLVSLCAPSYGWCDRLCFPLAPLRTAGVVGAAAGV